VRCNARFCRSRSRNHSRIRRLVTFRTIRANGSLCGPVDFTPSFVLFLERRTQQNRIGDTGAIACDCDDACQQILTRHDLSVYKCLNLPFYAVHFAFIQFERAPMLFALHCKFAQVPCQAYGFHQGGFEGVTLRVCDQNGMGERIQCRIEVACAKRAACGLPQQLRVTRRVVRTRISVHVRRLKYERRP
jgi:hypothetical protein